MKGWKMVGCLALLAVIICGCVMLGKNAKVAAQSTQGEKQEEIQEDTESANGENAAKGETKEDEEQNIQGSAGVEKAYSEGLSFRSNGDGSCAVVGIGSCTAACVLIPPESPAGDTVTEVLAFAFAESEITAIELPTTVTQLTAASFAKCDRLSYVRVASGNTAFCEYDGVLYTADGATLLYCPADRTATDLRLHPGLKRIAAGAFAECKTLALVYFAGSTAEWHALIVGDDNDALYSASFRFNAKG